MLPLEWITLVCGEGAEKERVRGWDGCERGWEGWEGGRGGKSASSSARVLKSSRPTSAV